MKFLQSESRDESTIRENIELIKNYSLKNPKDSIIYLDYFAMHLFIYDTDKVLELIDSIQNTNPQFSEMYYEYILKDAVKSNHIPW